MLAIRIVLRAVVAGVSLSVVGCFPDPPPVVDRRAKLLDLASGEATDIKNPFERLVRQLNFAYRQQEDYHPAETRQSLARATDTLRVAKPADLTDQQRIAGWVSVSELSRQADDRPAAERACGEAVDQLRKLPKVSDRPEYVVGVAAELKSLYGNASAAKLLVESAAWTKAIENTDERRAAVRTIADAAFHCDDYAGGEQVLRTDPDPAWRSDTLVALADAEPAPARPQLGAVGGLVADRSNGVDPKSFIDSSEMFPGQSMTLQTPMTPPSSMPAHYGKPVDFQSVFRRR